MDKESLQLFAKHIPLIIPAYEPDERMGELLHKIREDFDGVILIVNDGSGSDYDHYYEEAEALGCVIFRHYRNMGKGRGLKNAFNYCLSMYPDMVGCVTADSDGQHTPTDIYRCMEALMAHPDSLILGCRDFSLDTVPSKSRIGNNLTRKICKFLCGVDVSDTQTGLRGISKDFMADLLNTSGERFEFETRMLIDAKDKYPIHEITIETVYDSKENHQTHFDPIKDSIRIYKIFGVIFAKYLFSSLSSFVLDMVLFLLLCPLVRPLSAVYYVTLATVCARIVSSIYNYLLNYKFVFKSDAPHTSSALKYFLLAVIQMCCSAALVTVGAMILPIPAGFVKVVVDLILFFVSYAIQRAVVFAKKKA